MKPIAMAALAAGAFLLLSRQSATAATLTGAAGTTGTSGGTGSVLSANGGISAGDRAQLEGAYRSGDYSGLNAMIARLGVTAKAAADAFGLSVQSLTNMRTTGVVFADDPVTTAATTAAAPVVTAPPAVSAPADPLMQAYQRWNASGTLHDLSSLNFMLSSQDISAAEVQQQYGLPDSSLANLRAAGVVFGDDLV